MFHCPLPPSGSFFLCYTRQVNSTVREYRVIKQLTEISIILVRCCIDGQELKEMLPEVVLILASTAEIWRLLEKQGKV